ncbi:GntR family transcriptional regulator [Aquabacter spiritensis]|uniref:DNA-binding GntR family transcriptional regulator n=1 Tax=Aquabacter spiritensis TaxID=933073 RepID=A0A4R3LWP8_9HYPH|nr:GntR family transcriptional regulator [Aquabacter spiritensis]TCT04993.1 DNA-binding GntR family transcriptional regulator [Aquabacter spiritensis]
MAKAVTKTPKPLKADAPPRAEKASTSSLSRTAYEFVRRAIQIGQYSPGDRIREEEIADQLGVSRTPVRDAMRRLEADGFLVHESHRGMTIAQFDHQTVMELYAMWNVLEGAAASMAARHAADAEIELLEEYIALEPAEAVTAERMAEHNRKFHQAIYRSAHNRYLLKTLSVLSDSLDFLSRTTFTIGARRELAQVEHRAIVDAIRARDPEGAEKAARAHIRAALRARLTLLAETPDS